MKWSIIYLAAVLSANYTAVWFIPLPVFGLVALGTLLFGITFTARDYVHHLGRSRVYTMIFIATLAAAGLATIGTTPWRIVIASVSAIILAETADTEIYQRLLELPWLARVTGSNIVSIPIDTGLFNLLAFTGIFTLPVLISIMFGEIMVKFLVAGLVSLWKLT